MGTYTVINSVKFNVVNCSSERGNRHGYTAFEYARDLAEALERKYSENFNEADAMRDIANSPWGEFIQINEYEWRSCSECGGDIDNGGCSCEE